MTESIYAYTGGKPIEQNFGSSKPLLVFLHGAQLDHSVWALQSRHFGQNGFPVLAFDLPGHGKSRSPLALTIEEMASQVAPRIKRTLEAARRSSPSTRVIVIGHSMGSLIALELSSRLGTDLARIVLVGTAAPMKVSQSLLGLIEQNEQRAMEQINYWSHFRINGAPSFPGPGFSTYVQNLRLMQMQAKGTLLTDFNACNEFVRGEELAKAWTGRTLIVQGSNDAMTPLKAARSLAALFSKPPELVAIPQTGHNVMGERPDVLLRAIQQFVQGQ